MKPVPVAGVTIPALEHDYDENDICRRCREEKQTDVSKFTFEYDAEQGGYTIIGYAGEEADVIIPKKYNDGTNGVKDVKAIANHVFNNKVGLISVKILDNVTSIGANAFSGCVSLIDVHYNGTKEQWNEITKAEDIGFNDGVTRTIHCTDGTIVIGDVSGGGSEEAVGE